MMKQKMTALALLMMMAVQSWAYMGSKYPAPNFTKQDYDGNTYNLYDILDAGQHVAIKVTSITG